MDFARYRDWKSKLSVLNWLVTASHTYYHQIPTSNYNRADHPEHKNAANWRHFFICLYGACERAIVILPNNAKLTLSL